MTTIVAGILWASAAGSVIACALTGLVAAVIRLTRPSGSGRYLLWFMALASCAVAPAAILGAMLAHGPPTYALTAATTRSTESASAHRVVAEGDAASARSARRVGPTVGGARGGIMASPTLTRTIALEIEALWALGVLGGFAGLGRSLYRVQALKARSTPLEGTLADDLPWLTERAGREIYVRLSYEIETPIAVGFRRPVVLIPIEMATSDGLRAIEPLVMHEYAHLARYDDWWNLVQRVIERVVWFNPFVWYAGRCVALEREVAADDIVVERTNDANRYAKTLWRMAREMRMPEHVVVAPGAMLTRKQLSIRIERLVDESRSQHTRIGGIFLVFAVGASTVGAVAAYAPPLPPSAPIAAAPIITALPLATAAVPSAPPFPTPATSPPIAAIATHTPSREVPAAPAAPTTPPRRIAAAPTALDSSAEKQPPQIASHLQTTRELTRDDVANCHACDLRGRDLSNLDLSGLRLSGTQLDDADLSNVNLERARLSGVSLRNAHLANVRFRDAQIIGCNLQAADVHGLDLRNVRLVGSNFQDADAHGVDLRGAELFGINFQNADLDGADLRGARLTGANFSGASMIGTLTSGARIAGAAFP